MGYLFHLGICPQQRFSTEFFTVMFLVNLKILLCFFSCVSILPNYRVEGIMDTVKYRNILQMQILPHGTEKIPFGGRYQHDNNPKHTFRLVKGWFNDNKVNVLPWQAQISNLNPIEHLCENANSHVRG